MIDLTAAKRITGKLVDDSQQYYDMILSGRKIYEVRLDKNLPLDGTLPEDIAESGKWGKLQPGDEISFVPTNAKGEYSNKSVILTKVVGIFRFNAGDFRGMFMTLGIENVLPLAKNVAEGIEIYKRLYKDNIGKYPIVAIKIQVIPYYPGPFAIPYEKITDVHPVAGH